MSGLFLITERVARLGLPDPYRYSFDFDGEHGCIKSSTELSDSEVEEIVLRARSIGPIDIINVTED